MKKYWLANKGRTSLLILFILASEGLVAYIARVYGQIVDKARGGESGALSPLFILLVALSLLMPFCFYLYSLAIQFLRVRIQAAMRHSLFSSLLARDYKEYIREDEGQYLSSYTTEIDSLETSYFTAIFGILQIIAHFLFTFVILYAIYPKFAFYNLLGAVPVVLIPNLLKKKISRLQAAKIERVAANIARLNEYLSGLDTILLFGRRSAFRRQFREQTEAIRHVSRKIPALMVLTTNLSNLLLQLYSIAIIALATVEIAKGNVSVGVFITAVQIFSDQSGIAFTSHYLQQFHTSARTIEHILRHTAYEKTEIPSADACELNPSGIEKIEYRGVSFSFHENNHHALIRDFSYCFGKPGVYHITGASGSGKSTLMNLLCGYYTPDKGTIEIDGWSVRSISNLNECFTIMRQEAIFFEGSLRENITMFREHDDESLLAELKRLGLDNLDNLEDRNFHYSGGEKRRIMLLRALLRNTKIIILDEPLANLDAVSQRRVEEAISDIKDSFVFVISHEPLGIPVTATVTVGCQ